MKRVEAGGKAGGITRATSSTTGQTTDQRELRKDTPSRSLLVSEQT